MRACKTRTWNRRWQPRRLSARALWRTGAALVALAVFPAALAAQTWRGLIVAPEARCAPYERSDYTYAPAPLEALLVRELGGVYAPYSGSCLKDRRETDVEHIVALSEAHDSGLCGRSELDKVQFANDTLNLTLATPAVNREQKRHFDAAEWLPEKNRCWFAARVLAVRLKHRLTIDRAEAQALEGVLSRCRSLDLEQHCSFAE